VIAGSVSIHLRRTIVHLRLDDVEVLAAALLAVLWPRESILSTLGALVASHSLENLAERLIRVGLE
jgi:hypothetical protein